MLAHRGSMESVALPTPSSGSAHRASTGKAYLRKHRPAKHHDCGDLGVVTQVKRQTPESVLKPFMMRTPRKD